MRSSRLRKSIFCLIIILLADLSLSFAMISVFPQRELAQVDLYGEYHEEHLKDFSLDAGALLTALSDDPWIEYIPEDDLRVYSVRIWLSMLEGPVSRAQIYLMPDGVYEDFELRDYVNVRFGLSGAAHPAALIRFDLGSEEGIRLVLKQIRINDRRDILIDCQLVFIFFMALILIIMSELRCWRDFLRYRAETFAQSQKKVYKLQYILLIALQFAMKLALICLLRKELTSPGGNPALSISAWILIGGTELFSLVAILSSMGKLRDGIGAGFIAAVPLAFVQFGMSEVLSLMSFNHQSLFHFCLGLALCWTFTAVILSLTRRVGITLTLSAAALGLLSIANHYYSELRGSPLEYFDLSLTGTAMDVIGNYTISPDHLSMAALAAVCAIIAVSLTVFGGSSAGYALKPFLRGILAVAAAVIIVIKLVPTPFMWNLFYASEEEGYFLHFVSLIKMSRIETPAGYTSEKASMLLLEASESAAFADRASSPDIIVIMDESFADLPAIYGFEMSEDLLPGLHSLREDTIQGCILTSVYGGGTADTEYEFLTGNSLYFFPFGTTPMVQYLNAPTQSIASSLTSQDYSAIAYHPNVGGNYRRSEAYPLLGFEEFYTIEDELPDERYLREYLSDSADFANLIYLYETRDMSKPFFIFNITMQNHGGYDYEMDEIPDIVPLDNRLSDPDLLQYLYLIHETDSALTELIDYFSRVDNDVIILFFGDHQPSLSEELENFVGGGDGDIWYGEGQLRNYASFLIWANYDIEEAEDVIASPNYLRALLFEAAGVEMNAYEKFLLMAYDDMPAINTSGYTDAEGRWHYREEDDSALMTDYRYLIYANAFDSSKVPQKYFE